MLGYFGNQAATEQSFNRDGWFLSGDLGRLDERGNLQIVGRLKDMVIRGGHNIHPAKVEELALRHPQVERAAAFGVPDERLGERLCLAITCSARRAARRRTSCCATSGRSASPSSTCPSASSLLDAFPLTASGKILKRELAAWAQRRAGSRPSPAGSRRPSDAMSSLLDRLDAAARPRARGGDAAALGAGARDAR